MTIKSNALITKKPLPFLTNKAFTLLELLVVIGIISLLVGLSVTSYSTSQKKARDAKRKGDLKSIQNALEEYYSICGFKYPLTATGNMPTKIECSDPTATILDPVPLDPKGDAALNTNYQVVSADAQGTKYTVCPPEVRTGHRLESEDCDITNNPCCVSNQQ